MAFINLAGTLLDPNSEFAVGDKIRFTHKSTTGETIQGAVSVLTIPPDGMYDIDLQFGLVLVEYKDVRKSQFENRGVATVNGTNPATSIPELLNALVPVSSAELIEFQTILADCVTAQAAAAASAAEALASEIAAAASAASIDPDSLPIIFDTVADYEAYALLLTVGKTVHLNDRNSDSLVISGTGTATGNGIIASTLVNQSIEIITNDTPNIKGFGAEGLGGNYTAEISEALDTNPEKVAFAPPGEYSIDSDIDGTIIHEGNVTFIGVGNIYLVDLSKTQNADQIPFVDILRSLKPVTNQFRVYDANGNVDIMCIYGDGRYIQYYFNFVLGDYITQGTAYTGEWKIDTIDEQGILADAGIYTGTWIQSTGGASGYTTQTGATWEGTIINTVQGYAILSRHQIRNDGGKFNVTIRKNDSLGDIVKQLVVDTFNDVSTKAVKTLLSDADIGTYWIQFEFLDTSPTRGWLTSLTQNQIMTAQEVFDVDTLEFITTPSNKDFAIEVAPAEAPTSFNFVPSHSGVQTDFEKSPRKWLLDGVDTSVAVEDTVINFNNFKLVQHIYFTTPETTAGRELGEVYGIQEINEYGELVMTGYLKPNEEIIYGNGYTMMHVGHLETSDTFITGIGTEVPVVTPVSTANIPMPVEADTTLNFAYLGTSTSSPIQNLCSAMKVENPKKTRRQGESTKLPKVQMSYLQLRTASVAKFYSHLFDKPFASDEQIAWRGTYKYINSTNMEIFIASFK